ncbi:glycosyl hydrolase, partial [bacterium]|nr:glycosyl hydrolase [bacterium]
FWVGSNDGLLHISRDGGKNWKNITPRDLPAGGRVQTIDPSPHDAGSAFVAIYRYMLDDWAPYIFKTDDYGKTWQRLTDGTNGIPADYPTRVVREDPSRKGLLYAGTEFGMFVSFDDGVHWQPFQLDLPATPITDIRVHQQDLVLSTMGRSFWILDDLTPLHQLNEEVASSSAWLFEPRDTYRARWPSRRRRGDGATPEYPQPGAIIHYYLAEEPDGDITLEILDSAGQVVRTFSSDTTQVNRESGDEQAFMRPRAGSRRARLAKNSGMHRFAWDLRYPAPLTLEGAGNDDGPLAVPGTYQARLTIGNWSQTHRFELMIDPRVAKDGVTVADLNEQFQLNSRIAGRISKLRASVVHIRSLARQLYTIIDEAADAKDIGKKAKAVSLKLTEIEEALIQTKKGKIGAQLKPKLNRQLTYLYGMTTRADQKPGKDAHQRLQDIEKILGQHLYSLQSIVNKDLNKLNRTLEKQGLTPVKTEITDVETES